MVRIEKDMIREMVVLTTGNSNALVRIKGKIKPSDIEKGDERSWEWMLRTSNESSSPSTPKLFPDRLRTC